MSQVARLEKRWASNSGQRARYFAVDARYLSRPSWGIGVYVQGLIRLLLDAGVEVTLLVDQPIDKQYLDHRAKVCLLSGFCARTSLTWEQVSVPRFLYRHRFDAYVAPANKGIPLFYFGRTCLQLIVHDLIPLTTFRHYFRGRRVFALSYLLSFAAAMTRATRVVAVSQYTADEIRKRSFRKAVVAFTPLNLIGGIRHVRPREERDALFVYNGGLDGRKGVAELLLGFAEFIRERPDFKLVMMGRGYDGIADQTAALRKSGNLDLPGYLSEDEKFELIGRAEAVIYPSRLEGYGLPIAEAIASQTPVICGLGGAQREVGGDAAIYLKAVTAGEILDALRRVANHALPANYRERQASQLAWLTDDRHQTQLLSALGAPD